LRCIIAPSPKCVSIYVLCGGIREMMAWHRPETALEPKITVHSFTPTAHRVAARESVNHGSMRWLSSLGWARLYQPI
jgi:hypothetical protein